MFGRKEQRRLGYREKVGDRSSRGTIRKRSRKSRLTLPRKISEWSVSNFVEVRCALERAVENPPTRADARRPGFAQDLAEYSVIVSKRIRQSQSRRKMVPTGGRQRARNTWISGEHPPCR